MAFTDAFRKPGQRAAHESQLARMREKFSTRGERETAQERPKPRILSSFVKPKRPIVKEWAWCPICDKRFISQKAVDAHQRIHKPKENTMAKAVTKEFPQEVFLKLETETNDDPYFVHYESAEEVAEPDKEIEVGVYRLVGKAKVKAPVTVDKEDAGTQRNKDS